MCAMWSVAVSLEMLKGAMQAVQLHVGFGVRACVYVSSRTTAEILAMYM